MMLIAFQMCFSDLSLQKELEVKEKALLQLNDRFAITKEQMNHLQEEFASLADKSKKEIAEKDEVRWL